MIEVVCDAPIGQLICSGEILIKENEDTSDEKLTNSLTTTNIKTDK